MDRILNHYLDLVDYQRLAHYMQHLNIDFEYRFIDFVPYLGTIMTPSNSFAKCRVHLFKQANKAMWGFLTL